MRTACATLRPVSVGKKLNSILMEFPRWGYHHGRD
jgi:hypothetical protein